MMAPAFDVTKARAQFPSLKQDQVYFDNAGGSQTLGTVIESISDYLSNNNVQMGASYAIGQKSTNLFREGCKAGARYINAEDDEVVDQPPVLGPSTTQLFCNLSYALKFSPGDELILSKLDHEANLASWVSIAERLNLKIIWWTVPPTTNPKLNPSDLQKLLTPRTKLVACTHTSNILGTLNPIAQIAEVVHTIPGALLVVDGVAHAPHRAIDVKELGVDFYAFSWYKCYGPHFSMLFASRVAQEQVGSLGMYFNPKESLGNKLALAGESYEFVQCLPRILEYLGGEDKGGFFEGVEAHEQALQKILLDFLNARDDVTIYGEKGYDSKIRVPTISFLIKGWGSRELVETVEKISPFGFRWGHFYSKRLCDEILQVGEEGVVRVSMVHYNTEEEIKGFVRVLGEVLETGKA
ncbi:PLP-dependent transferase [Tothia fuscella]|uniref:PLP-dependent transferase n=1 Tax=Tothia fuscella TaxID=1048955 RepID=A0A9P4NZ77_9PEZI|nr:PLP-dependent transferase [Tothia fuscella]